MFDNEWMMHERSHVKNLFLKGFVMKRNMECASQVIRAGHWGHIAQHKKVTIHQVTTMLSTSKNVLFPGYNHLLTIGADDLTL